MSTRVGSALFAQSIHCKVSQVCNCNLDSLGWVVYNHWTGLVDWTKNHFLSNVKSPVCRVTFGTFFHRL